MKMFTEEFKMTAVQKYLSRGSKTVAEICDDLGVANPTLYEWVKKYSTINIMSSKNRRPQDWTAEERMRACFEYEKLSNDEQGEFLRREGLHSDHLAEWKKICLDALALKNNQAASRTEVNEANRKIKELERELYRKDKALAETTALLVLKKKANLIWGLPEE